MFKRLMYLITAGREIDELIRELRHKKEDQRRQEDQHRLNLCFKHRQESNFSHYSEHNCDHCKLMRKLEG